MLVVASLVNLAMTETVFAPFPRDFAWGVATAAYQVEGAYNTDGKGPSIWDDFCENPGVIDNGDDGKVADDFYHRYAEDISLTKNMGVKNFRLSISWPRVLPNGTVESGINQKGVDFYNTILDELISSGIDPWVTLYHWDLPSALNKKSA